jgi:hypothetical protein
MSKTVVIMQPTYLPWLGYFDLINRADVFVFYDHVQFSKQSWQQRNKLRDKNGEILLTVPVKHTATKEDCIKDIQIDHARRPLQSHYKSIELNYNNAPFANDILTNIKEMYNTPYEHLAALNIALIKWGCKMFNVSAQFEYSSTLDVEGDRVEALITICKHFNANKYLSPVGSKNYIDNNDTFAKNGIELIYQSYTHPIYQQKKYADFISHLGFIDYLLNCGPKKFNEIGS